MAFFKTASAKIVRPDVELRQWRRQRRTASTGINPTSIVEQATRILEEPFDPKNYLLTHATIVCSVDVEHVPGAKTGRDYVSGEAIKRLFTDYYITKETEHLVNDNGDAWSRGVILKSYSTFRGAQNYLEHVQDPAQSKGRIIDAVIRDTGTSLYVDILVATSRKHTALIADILSGKMSTMSMGCFLPGTQVVMGDGRRVAIEDVQPGDMVLTHTGQVREVLNKQDQLGEFPLRKIRAVGVSSTIQATEEHPFFVYRPAQYCGCGCGEPFPSYSRDRKQTSRKFSRRFLRGHDKRIFNPNNTYSPEESLSRKETLDAIPSMQGDWIEARDLRVGDLLCFPRLKPSESPLAVSNGLARLLGYFLAEGSFLKRKGEATAVDFTFSLEERDTYAAEVVSLLKQEFPDACSPTIQERQDRNTCSVRISGREVATWFLVNGGEYCHGKKLSSEVMSWSEDNHKNLLGAWINGDGCLHPTSGHTSGTTVSYDLVCQLQMLLARVGIWARMMCKWGRKSVDVQQVVNSGFVRSETTGRLPAFSLTFGKIQAQILRGVTDKVGSCSVHSEIPRIQGDAVLYPIVSIEEDTYQGWVHNMAVADDNSYVVEGVAVHNCSALFTICTKCGNVAYDDSDTCPCIRYSKGSKFLDASGNIRLVAELCGHVSIDPNGGVEFIEGSFVENPAFKGAVLRNVVDNLTPDQVRSAQDVFSRQASTDLPWDFEGVKRAASKRQVAFDFDDEGDDESSDEPAKEEKSEEKDRLKKVEDQAYDAITQRVTRRIMEDLDKADGPRPDSDGSNNNLLNYASVIRMAHSSMTEAEVIDKAAAFFYSQGVYIHPHIYRKALTLGALDLNHPGSKKRWAAAYRKAQLDPRYKGVMIVLGRLLSQRPHIKPMI